MNDFDYDNLCKKRLAKNSIHRKCGSKSTKCTLPSDYLTAKQRKELNGMEVTYQMNKPVAWNVFKMWPSDIQREYLSGLSERYHVNANRLADMFRIARSTFVPYCKNHGLTDCVTNRGHMSALELAKWKDFATLGTAARPERRVYDEAGEGESTTLYKGKESKEARSMMTSTVASHGEEQTVDIPAIVVPVEPMQYVDAPKRDKRVRTRPTPADFEMSFEVGTDDVDTEAVLEFVKGLLEEEPKGMLTVRFQRARKKRSDKKVQGFCAPDGENEA